MAGDHRARLEPDALVGATAHWIAAVRARESARPDRLFDDPWAGALAGRTGRRIMQASERAGGRRNEFVPVRVRWFDDLVTGLASARQVAQVVLLGAGLDTRAFRLDLPPDLRWFEIDQASVLAAKAPVLGAAVPRCRRTTVVADLAGEWPPVLAATEFDAGAATLWLAEGLLVYLGEEAVLTLLRTTASLSGPGSRFAADVFSAGAISRRQGAGVMRFGTDDPGALLAAGGWRPERADRIGSPAASYGRFPAGAHVPDGTLVVGRR